MPAALWVTGRHISDPVAGTMQLVSDEDLFNRSSQGFGTRDHTDLNIYSCSGDYQIRDAFSDWLSESLVTFNCLSSMQNRKGC